jgi:hypothetical protein
MHQCNRMLKYSKMYMPLKRHQCLIDESPEGGGGDKNKKKRERKKERKKER